MVDDSAGAPRAPQPELAPPAVLEALSPPLCELAFARPSLCDGRDRDACTRGCLDPLHEAGTEWQQIRAAGGTALVINEDNVSRLSRILFDLSSG